MTRRRGQKITFIAESQKAALGIALYVGNSHARIWKVKEN